MEIEIFFDKSIEENASMYFEKSKKARKKLVGLRQAIEKTKKRISVLEKTSSAAEKETVFGKRNKQWFEGFHWFFSSQGFLVVGGRNAKSNEVLVKKHFEQGDKFLHADVHGGSACIVKSFGKEVPDDALAEAAVFAGVFSSAWKAGLPAVDIYAVEKEQVSKHAKSGESLGTGAFMIYGKRQWFRKVPLELFVGAKKEKSFFVAFSGPKKAVEKNCSVFLRVLQGSVEKIGMAKRILAFFQKNLGKKTGIALDDVVSVLPNGGIQIGENQ